MRAMMKRRGVRASRPGFAEVSEPANSASPAHALLTRTRTVSWESEHGTRRSRGRGSVAISVQERNQPSMLDGGGFAPGGTTPRGCDQNPPSRERFCNMRRAHPTELGHRGASSEVERGRHTPIFLEKRLGGCTVLWRVRGGANTKHTHTAPEHEASGWDGGGFAGKGVLADDGAGKTAVCAAGGASTCGASTLILIFFFLSRPPDTDASGDEAQGKGISGDRCDMPYWDSGGNGRVGENFRSALCDFLVLSSSSFVFPLPGSPSAFM